MFLSFCSFSEPYVWASIQNHGDIPDIDEDAFKLEIGGLVNNPVKVTMKDLKDPSKFPCAQPYEFSILLILPPDKPK